MNTPHTEGEPNPAASTAAIYVGHHWRRCLFCGYSLLGLSDDARCPECAEPVSRSVALSLASQPPGTLRRLQQGALCVLVAVGLQLLVGGMTGFAPMLLLAPMLGGDPVVFIILAAAFGLFGLALQVAIAWGYWRLTSALHGDAPRDWVAPRLRSSIRVMTVAMLVLVLMMLGCGALVALHPDTRSMLSEEAAPAPRASWIGAMIAFGSSMLLLSIGEFLRLIVGSLYMATLARRAPDPKARATARAAARIGVWLMGGTVIIVLLTVIAGLAASSGQSGGASGAAAAIAGILSGILTLVGTLATFGLIIVWIVAYAMFIGSLSQIRASLRPTPPKEARHA